MFELVQFAAPQSTDEHFMTAALSLAQLGRGEVEPNPVVGAVIVRGGREIARGWHRRFGGPHAEIEALRAAADEGVNVHGATMYVTLEPCCHHGKTPPCTETILEAGIARVVAAMADPDENVAGGGIAKLRAAGVQVDVGVCEDAARTLLAPYRKLREQRRPWVICKWAQTADGYLALPAEYGRFISGPDSRAAVHELRAFCDGILVGAGTLLSDDPMLTNRAGTGKQPTRVVLDSRLRTPLTCRVVTTAGETPTIIATTPAGVRGNRTAAAALGDAGVELLDLPAGEEGISIPALLDELGRRQWTYLLVEGGSRVLSSFILPGLADELWAFVANDPAPDEAAGEPTFNIADLAERLSLPTPQEIPFRDDLLLRYVLRA